MSEKKVVISCQGVGLGYERKCIIENFDFKVEQQDYICILGKNGAGKSTLIKTILGLNKPVYGQMEVDATMKSIGYLPQQTEAQKDFPATVNEIVMSGFLSTMGHRPFYTRKEKEQAKRNMELLDVLSMRKKCFRELSGGQKQRVLLARALCASDGLLILDEPITGLDPLATVELYKTLRQLNKENNMTILMVTHDFKNALEEADKVLHIGDEGQFFGTVDQYRESEFIENLSGGIA